MILITHGQIGIIAMQISTECDKMNIYYDYHEETKFGQITVCDEDGEKISVVNIEQIKENEFKQLFIVNKYTNGARDNFEYGLL